MSPRLAIVSAASVAALCLGTAFALPAFALPGDDPNCPEQPGKTCTQTPPKLGPTLCPLDYAPAPQQPAVGVVCLYVGPSPYDKDTHAAARINPILCVHLAIGTDNEQRQVVRSLRCPKVVPDEPSEPTQAPIPTPAPASTTPALPTAPAPVIVVNHLPVTH